QPALLDPPGARDLRRLERTRSNSSTAERNRATKGVSFVCRARRGQKPNVSSRPWLEATPPGAEASATRSCEKTETPARDGATAVRSSVSAPPHGRPVGPGATNGTCARGG